MARMRTLKPEFWTDDVIVELSAWARLFYMGCWNFALCDQGHLDDSPKSLKLKILPADPVDAVALVEELIEHGRLVRKETPEGRTYLHIRTLADHSKADTRWNSRCTYCASEGLSKPVSAPPSPPNHTETRESSGEHTETRSSKGKEGEVKEGSSASRSARAEPPAEATTLPGTDIALVDDVGPKTVGELMAYWIERCKVRPPERVLGHMSKEIKRLAGEGIDPHYIALGIDEFLTKDVSPAVMPSLVNSAMNRRPPTRAAPSQPTQMATTDKKILAGKQLAAQLRALEGGQR